jgi:hypothetical protein
MGIAPPTGLPRRILSMEVRPPHLRTAVRRYNVGYRDPQLQLPLWRRHRQC